MNTPEHAGDTHDSDEQLDAFAAEQSLAADELAGTDERVAALQVKLADAEKEVLKSHAELENFRKRMQRDADQQLKFANVPLVRDLLEVVDNLHRALASASQEGTGTSALRDGVQMVTDQLSGVLAKYACKPIEAQGQPFDPNFHAAIAQAPSAEVPAGHVLQEVAVGYTLHDRVVRPSQVIVSTGAGT
jgi:molecular chaperone GrpE